MNPDAETSHRTGHAPVRPSLLSLRASLGERRRDLGLQTLHARVAIGAAVQASQQQAARQLVAAGYATLAGGDVPAHEVARDLYTHADDASHHGLCVVAHTAGVVLATAALGLPDGGQITEALRLFHAPRPWAETLGVPAHRVGEMGRFAMAPVLQRTENRRLAVDILRELVVFMLGVARDAGLQRVVAIMPHATRRMTAQTGLRFHPLAGAELAVHDARCAPIFHRYPRYWLPANAKLRPRLFWFDWPATPVAGTTLQEIAHDANA